MSKCTTVRRSVALPRELVDEVDALAPRELKGNFNRLVITALGEYAKRRRDLRFQREMAAMARDPDIKADCAAIAETFMSAETDGLDGLT